MVPLSAVAAVRPPADPPVAMDPRSQPIETRPNQADLRPLPDQAAAARDRNAMIPAPALVELGQAGVGLEGLEEGFERRRAAGAVLRQSLYVAAWGLALIKVGRKDEAVRAIEQAVELAESGEEVWGRSSTWLAARSRPGIRTAGRAPRSTAMSGRLPFPAISRPGPTSFEPRTASPDYGATRTRSPQPATSSGRSTTGSPRPSTRPISRTPRPCSISWARG